MTDTKMDLGNLKSRDVGNLISKQLVDLGKDAVQRDTPNGYVDYGNLPSKTLPELGKQAAANKMNQKETT